MSNKFRGEVEVKPGVLLRFTTNNLVLLEDALGCPITQIPEEPTISQVRSIVWAGLGGELSPEDVGNLIDEVGFAAMTERVTEAFRAVFESGEGDPGTGKKRQRSTGRKRS